MSKLENNKYYQQWLRGYQSENVLDDRKGIPPDGEEPTTGSPNVTSSSVPSMDVATKDIKVQDVVLSSKSTVKVPSSLMDKNPPNSSI